MPTVAHEGNYRTASIVVTGTLDGNIYLIPIPGGTVVPPAPLPPPPSAPQGWQFFPSGPEKYVVATDFQYGQDVADNAGTVQDTNSILVGPETFLPSVGTITEYSTKSNIPLYGLVRSQPVLTNRRFYDEQLSVVSPVHQNFFSLDFQDTTVIDYDRYKKPTSPFADITILETYSTALVSTVAAGSPFAGVAVGVTPTSTADNFTGIVSAYNWANNIQYLMRYDNQSLSAPGTIYTSAARAVLAVDDSMQVRIRFVPASGLFSIIDNVNSVSAVTVDSVPYFGADMRVGLVNLPSTTNTGGDDLIIWKSLNGSHVFS